MAVDTQAEDGRGKWKRDRKSKPFRIDTVTKGAIVRLLLENQEAKDRGERVRWYYKDIIAQHGTSHGYIHSLKEALGIPMIRHPRQARTIAKPSQAMPEPPTFSTFTPADFVKAFEDRHDEFKTILYAREHTIKSQLDEIRVLRDTVTQLQAHLANYAPSSSMGKSLGNGG